MEGVSVEEHKYLIEYYDRGLEDERLTSRVGSVEFLTTMVGMTSHSLDIFRKCGNNHE
jgi:hypothetical protein